MTGGSPDVAAFITARLDDEEATALMAPKGPWTWTAADTSSYPQRVTNPTATLIAQCYENPDLPASCAEHIAMQDPAVTLARVEALRALAGVHYRLGCVPEPGFGDAFCPACHDPDRPVGHKFDAWPCADIRRIAAIWRWHPDYRTEWTP